MFEKWNYNCVVDKWGIHGSTIATHGADTTPKYNQVHINLVYNPMVLRLRTASLLTDGVEALGGSRGLERAEHNEIIAEFRKEFQFFARLPL